MLCAIGMHNRAPFKSVATYGWTLDEKAGPSPNPSGTAISGEITDKLGAEIVRLWVASVDFRRSVVASLPLLRRLAEEIYRKLRNTFRFLLGTLRETDPTTGLATPLIRAGRCGSVRPDAADRSVHPGQRRGMTGKIPRAHEEMEFHRVYHLLNEFCNSELWAFYLDVLKDRLYTYPVKFKPGHD